MPHFAQRCDKSNSGSLEGSEIKHFYDLLTHREEIDVIYGKYAETEGQMSTRDLLNFLLNEQREQASFEDALKLIEKYEMDGTGKINSEIQSAVPLICGSCSMYCIIFIMCTCPLFASKGKETHDKRWLPDVPGPRGGIHLQPSPQTCVPGHEPAPQPLLHLILAQHVPDGRPTQRAQQHRGLHKVTTTNIP